MTTSHVSMKRIPLILLAVLVLAAAGCGSGSKDNNSSANPSNNGSPSGSAPDTRTSENTTSTESATSGGTVTIDMKNIAFDPASVTVKVGQTVKWTNSDDAPHNVTGGPLKSKTFGKGGSFEFTPKKAETISYVCTVHPGMNGKLTVTS
jgi:plastocyanin